MKKFYRVKLKEYEAYLVESSSYKNAWTTDESRSLWFDSEESANNFALSYLEHNDWEIKSFDWKII